MQPLEVIGAPFTIWIAPAGTTFPDIDEDDPTAEDPLWTLLGTSGSKSYSAPVTMEENVDTNHFTPEGGTMPRKLWVTEETRIVHATVADMTLETLSEGLNRNTVSDVAATTTAAGYRSMGLSRGPNSTELSLLVRGIGLSPYLADYHIQWEIPRCVEMASRTIETAKGEPSAVEFEFFCLEDLNAATEQEAFGRIIAADEAPS